MDLYRELSSIIGVRVTEHNLRSLIPVISAKGGFNPKKLQDIVFVLIEKVTELGHNMPNSKPESASSLSTLSVAFPDALVDDKPEPKPTGGKKK